MSASASTSATTAFEEYDHLRSHWSRVADRFRRRANALSLVNLATVGGALIIGVAAVSQGLTVLWTAFGFLSAGFVASYAVQASILSRRRDAEVRRGIADRHISRIAGNWRQLPADGSRWVEPSHPYAWDIDLVGPGSLVQRIDVCRTQRGEQCLVRWLAAPANAEVIRERQQATRELAGRVGFREALEAAGTPRKATERLDAEGFLEFTKSPPFLLNKRRLQMFIHLLPALTTVAAIGSAFGVVSALPLVALVLIQGAIVIATGSALNPILDRVLARQAHLEPFHRLVHVIERSHFESPLLTRLQAQLRTGNQPASVQFRQLDRWAGLAALRTQMLAHVPINFVTLWDLHVLLRLERWNAAAGKHLPQLLDAIAEVEALSSLGGFAFAEPHATFPSVVDSRLPYEASSVAHPLLHPDSRIENDLALRGPGSALIVTGSNMAGKSTLLRSVGLNIALGLAGGPVCAGRMQLPEVRLRASMRAQDSLQEGASYFHAELTKLQTVIGEADREPPIFFLLDELLRGTNAHARHVGARAVLMHLLRRGATGLVATHDVALARLEETLPENIANAHFTDVVINGEMKFDYRLRPGVVQTSNALRLLQMAGIEVDDR